MPQRWIWSHATSAVALNSIAKLSGTRRRRGKIWQSPVAGVDAVKPSSEWAEWEGNNGWRSRMSREMVAFASCGRRHGEERDDFGATVVGLETTVIFDLASKGNPPSPSPTYTRGVADNVRETKS